MNNITKEDEVTSTSFTSPDSLVKFHERTEFLIQKYESLVEHVEHISSILFPRPLHYEEKTSWSKTKRFFTRLGEPFAVFYEPGTGTLNATMLWVLFSGNWLIVWNTVMAAILEINSADPANANQRYPWPFYLYLGIFILSLIFVPFAYCHAFGLLLKKKNRLWKKLLWLFIGTLFGTY